MSYRTIMPKGFAVLRYAIKAIFESDSHKMEYEKFYGRDDRRNRVIPKSEAFRLIETHSLKKVVDNAHGCVWE